MGIRLKYAPTINRVRRQTIVREKIFAKDVFDKGLVCKICKGLLKLNNKKIKIKKMGKRSEQTTPKKKIGQKI